MAKKERKDQESKQQLEIHVTKKMYKKLQDNAKKAFPIKEVKKYFENNHIIPYLWRSKINQAIKLDFHPKSGIWCVENTRTAVNEMINAINRAQEVICICSFLINDAGIIEALLNANNRGVRVYLLTTTLKIKKSISSYLPDYELERFNQHVKMLERIAKKILIRCREGFHAKFLLVDPNKDNFSRGFLSTANFNKIPLTEKLELIVELKKEQVKDFYNLFVTAFWKRSSHDIFELDRVTALKQPEDEIHLENNVIKSKSVIYTFFNKHLNIKKTLLDYIEHADFDLCISTYGIDDDHQLVSKLAQHIRKGYEVHIFTRTRPEQLDVLAKLKEHHFKIYGHPDLHAKFIIPFGGLESNGYIFTANFQNYGMDDGFEIGIQLSRAQTTALQKLVGKWIEGFPYRFQYEIKANELHEREKVLLPGKNSDFLETVVKQYSDPIQHEYKVHDIRKFINEDGLESKISVPKESNDGDLYRFHCFNIKMEVPVLPKNSILIQESKNYSIFKNNEERYIGICKEKDLNKVVTNLADKMNAKIVYYDKVAIGL